MHKKIVSTLALCLLLMLALGSHQSWAAKGPPGKGKRACVVCDKPVYGYTSLHTRCATVKKSTHTKTVVRGSKYYRAAISLGMSSRDAAEYDRKFRARQFDDGNMTWVEKGMTFASVVAGDRVVSDYTAKAYEPTLSITLKSGVKVLYHYHSEQFSFGATSIAVSGQGIVTEYSAETIYESSAAQRMISIDGEVSPQTSGQTTSDERSTARKIADIVDSSLGLTYYQAAPGEEDENSGYTVSGRIRVRPWKVAGAKVGGFLQGSYNSGEFRSERIVMDKTVPYPKSRKEVTEVPYSTSRIGLGATANMRSKDGVWEGTVDIGGEKSKLAAHNLPSQKDTSVIGNVYLSNSCRRLLGCEWLPHFEGNVNFNVPVARENEREKTGWIDVTGLVSVYDIGKPLEDPLAATLMVKGSLTHLFNGNDYLTVGPQGRVWSYGQEIANVNPFDYRLALSDTGTDRISSGVSIKPDGILAAWDAHNIGRPSPEDYRSPGSTSSPLMSSSARMVPID